MGKVIDLDVEASSASEARAQVERMCERLLANPLIESYDIELDGERLVTERRPADRGRRLPRLERRPRRRLGAVRAAEPSPQLVWHAETELRRVEAVVLPGGFSYGDYLRAGAIARFAPAIDVVADLRPRRRPRAGDLQRIPDPLRGRPPSGRPEAERVALVRLPRRAAGRRTRRHRSSPPGASRVRSSSSPSSTATAATRRRPTCREEQIVLRYAPGTTRTARTTTSRPS